MTAASQGPGRPRGRRRAALSLEAVIDGAVELLDSSGQSALTFRALAARLGGGVASIYWYVDGREELLDRATDAVMGEYLEATEHLAPSADPLADLRVLAIAMFDTISAHPWSGAYLMRDSSRQPRSLRAYDRMGRPALRLGLSARDTFFAVSSVLGFVVGTAIDLGQEPPQEVLDGEVGRDAVLARWAQEWRELDAEEFPFLHTIVDEFDGHDDAEQFRAGLDLMLAGIGRRAGL